MNYTKLYLMEENQRESLKNKCMALSILCVVFSLGLICILLPIGVSYGLSCVYSVGPVIGLLVLFFIFRKLAVSIEETRCLYNEDEMIIKTEFKKEVTFYWQDISYYEKSPYGLKLRGINNKVILTVPLEVEGLSDFEELIVKKKIQKKDRKKTEDIKNILMIFILVAVYIFLEYF